MKNLVREPFEGNNIYPWNRKRIRVFNHPITRSTTFIIILLVIKTLAETLLS